MRYTNRVNQIIEQNNNFNGNNRPLKPLKISEINKSFSLVEAIISVLIPKSNRLISESPYNGTYEFYLYIPGVGGYGGSYQRYVWNDQQQTYELEGDPISPSSLPSDAIIWRQNPEGPGYSEIGGGSGGGGGLHLAPFRRPIGNPVNPPGVSVKPGYFPHPGYETGGGAFYPGGISRYVPDTSPQLPAPPHHPIPNW